MAGFLDSVLNPDPNSISPESLKAKRLLAQAIAMRGADTSPIGSWTQGAARVADALVGNLEGVLYDKQEAGARKAAADQFAKLFGVAPGTPSPAAAPATGTPAGMQPPAGGTAPVVQSAPLAAPTPSPSGGVFDVPQQYAAMVADAAKKYGVPHQLLASTGYNESRWQPNAVAPGDQPAINPATGRRYDGRGLMGWGDNWAAARGFNAADPAASIDQAGAVYKEYMDKYGGNPLLARLAYGWGPGNVDAWLKGGGDPNRIPDGAKVWLPRTAFGIAGEAEARAAFPRIADLLKPGAHFSYDGAAPAAAPQGAPAAAPGAQPPANPAAGAIPQIDPRAAMSVLSSPWLSEGQRSIVAAILGQQLKPSEYGFQSTPNGLVRTNPRTGQFEIIPGTAPPRTPTVVAPGSTVIDPATGRVIFSGGSGAAMLSPQEVAAAGLQPGTVAQRGPDGKINVIQAPPNNNEVNELRKEFTGLPSYKSYTAAIPAYQSMVEAVTRNDKSADLNLIYGLAKILDPNSVVREGETVMVKGTGSIFDQIRSMVSQVEGGAALTPEVRAGLMREAQSRMQAFRTALDADLGAYGGIADRRQYKRDDVLPKLPDMPAFDPASISTQARPPVPQQGPAAAPPAQQNMPVMQSPDEARAKLKPGDTFRTPDGRVLRVPGAPPITTVPMPPRR